jgi:hypothetical protein
MDKGIFKEIVQELNEYSERDTWHLNDFKFVQGETTYSFKWEAEGDWVVDHRAQCLEQKGTLAEEIEGCVEIHKFGVIRDIKRYSCDYDDYDYEYSDFEACEIREVEIPAYVELQWVEMREI